MGAISSVTVVYYTAGFAPESFLSKMRESLLFAKGDLPLISISQKPLEFGENICVGEIGRSHLNIYKQALVGAKRARTKYIALVEDDTLYSSSHFSHIPRSGCFAYNKNSWSLYTWDHSCYSYKDRRTLNNLVCERDLFIEAMEERFARYPDDSMVDLGLWAEPGKYERQLGVTVRETEVFTSEVSNVAFSHEHALAYEHLGRRKRMGYLKAIEIPFWGRSDQLAALYV